jgi:hypothetical protein
MGDDREGRARDAVRKMIGKLPWLFSKESSRKLFRKHLEAQDPVVLVAAAKEGDKDDTELLRTYACGARRTGMAIPAELQEFALECFIEGPPQAKSGPKPQDNLLRYPTIALMVHIVHKDFGIQEYRNTDHRGEKTGPMSACLLVAEELNMSERRIEEIWGELKDGTLAHLVASRPGLGRPN